MDICRMQAPKPPGDSPLNRQPLCLLRGQEPQVQLLGFGNDDPPSKEKERAGAGGGGEKEEGRKVKGEGRGRGRRKGRRRRRREFPWWLSGNKSD